MTEVFFDSLDEEEVRVGVFEGGLGPGGRGARVVFEPVAVLTGR